MLWRLVARGPAQGCPDVLRLAAYVDRRLDPTGVDAIENHLAGCAACLDAVRAAAAAPADTSRAAADRAVVTAAQALMTPPRPARAAPPQERAGRPSVLGRLVRCGLAAAAAVAVSVAGYQAGLSTPRAAEPNVAGEVSFGLLGSWSGEPDQSASLFLVVDNEEVRP
jgi:anti-sigma factor RsiW